VSYLRSSAKKCMRELSGNSSQPKAGQNYPAGQFRSPEDLTAAYLSELVKHLMYTLEEKLGSAILQTIPLQFVLTVPAIWSESAKLKTLAACQRAGIKSQSEVLLVSEPVSEARQDHGFTNNKARKLRRSTPFTALTRTA
jgi:molecular chaperone DnaK (HSP70)